MPNLDQVKAALLREFVPLAIIVAVAAGLQRLTHRLFLQGKN